MPVYTVKAGDTLSAIARRHMLKSWQDLYYDPSNAPFRARRPDPNLIFPGDQINVPTGGPGASPLYPQSSAVSSLAVEPVLQTYLGLGIKGGGFLGVAGHQALEARLYSVDDFDDRFNLNGDIWTAGVGLGGGVNLQLVICFGGTKPQDFQGLRFDGWDFNVSLGGRWGDVLKGAKKVPGLVKIARALHGAKLSGAVLKGLLKLSPEEWEHLGELAKTIRDRLEADPAARKPQVNSFDLPLLGAAVELSVYHYWGTVKSIY